MKIAHVIESISPSDGGPPSVVMHMAAAQSSLANDVKIVTYTEPQNQRWWSAWLSRIPELSQVELHQVPRSGLYSKVEIRELRGLRENNDIVHVHGIWRRLAWNTLSDHRRGRALTVLAPHGMLSPWALNHRRFRKQVALAVGWRRLIGTANALHAVSMGEQQEIEALIADARITLIPNGVSMSEVPSLTPDRTYENYILFVARLHEMKGPDRLVEAFAELTTRYVEFADYRLILAGPDFGAQSALKAQVKRLGLQDRVDFPGAVFDDAKRRLYQGAALVCQPSRYEAFSLSLLESLAAGVPVVTTPEANFPEVHSAGAGIVSVGQPSELAKNMRRLLIEPGLRAQMSTRGRALVRDCYTWDRIASRSLQAYAELCANTLN